MAAELVIFSISLAKVHQKCYTLAVEVEGGVANGWKERGKKTVGKGLRVALFRVRDGDYWTESVGEGEKNEWRGFAFERLCLAHVRQIKKALGISGVHTDVYSWKCSAPPELRGAQVDLLLARKDGIVNLCEMKFSKGKYAIDEDEHRKIANRVAAFEEVIGSGRTIHVTLVTTHGLVHNQYWNDVHSEVILDDLFAE